MSRSHSRERSSDSRAVHIFKADFKTIDCEQLQLLSKDVLLNTCCDERTENHVSARTSKTVKVKRPHFLLTIEEVSPRRVQSGLHHIATIAVSVRDSLHTRTLRLALQSRG